MTSWFQWAHLEQDHLTCYKKRSKLQRLIRTRFSSLPRGFSGTGTHSYSRLNPRVEPTRSTETSTKMSQGKVQETQQKLHMLERNWFRFFEIEKAAAQAHPCRYVAVWKSPHLWYSHGQIQAIQFHFTWGIYLHVGSLSWEPESSTRTCLTQILPSLFPQLL